MGRNSWVGPLMIRMNLSGRKKKRERYLLRKMQKKYKKDINSHISFNLDPMKFNENTKKKF